MVINEVYGNFFCYKFQDISNTPYLCRPEKNRTWQTIQLPRKM